MGSNPTMNDVARVAGVALKTVSRYVNGATNINPELAKRIGQAIAELGYTRNLAAASIRPGWTSKLLGLVISDLSNPYYSALTQSIERTARRRGYLLISSSSEEEGHTFDRVIDRLIEQRVDALIVVPPRNASPRRWRDAVPPIPPTVILDRPTDAFANTSDTILADNTGGAELAVRALTTGGARRIAFVGDSLDLYTMRQRYDGYRSALMTASIPFDRSLVATDAHKRQDATSSVQRLNSEAAPDAIFAANNRAAVGALHAFRTSGERLPLVAFDDFEAAHLASPAVSVVTQDIEEMGRLAADRAIARATGDGHLGTTTILPTTLILRGSELPTVPANTRSC